MNPEKIDFKTPESTANYEGNASILLFERVKNPTIRNQIIDLLFKAEESRAGAMVLVPETKPDGTRVINPETGYAFFKEIPYVPLTRQEVEQNLDETIKREESETAVEFGSHPYKSSSHVAMEINVRAPWNDQPYTEKQMSLIEAHEKGHNVRWYEGLSFEEHFRRAAQFDTRLITDSDVEIYRKGLSEEDRSKTDTEIRESYIQYMTNPMEIAERMSQLKNYFGMNGDDVFTHEHLTYAREHYIKDTGLDNGMRVFFDAITPETETEFIRLINVSGI